MHTRHKHTTSAWRETLTLSIHEHLQLHTSQYKQKTQHKHTTYFNTPRLKQHYFKQRPLHNKHSHRPPHNHHNRHKTNMCHIHTSIVSRHLATRGNNKILHTPPPHISSSEEQLPWMDNTELLITNMYIPPASSCNGRYSPPINHLLTGTDWQVLGDFNAHH